MIRMKDAGAKLPVELDWTGDLAAGDSISTAEWTVVPNEVGGLVVSSPMVSSPMVNGLKLNADLDGGIEGRLYQVKAKITTALGHRDVRSIVIRIGAIEASPA